MDKRTVLAVILIAIVLFAHQLYLSKYYPQKEVGQAEKGQEAKLGGENRRSTAEESTKSEISETPKTIGKSEKETGLAAEEVKVVTDKYVVSLSNEGGCIKEISLKGYPSPETGQPSSIVNVAVPREGILNMAGLGEDDLSEVTLEIVKKEYEVLFYALLPSWLKLTKRYSFEPASYKIEFEVTMENLSDYQIETEYSIVAGSNIDIATKLDRRYAQIVSDISGKARRDNGRRGKGIFVEGAVNYTGLQNKYFSVITKPQLPGSTNGAYSKETENNNLLTSIRISKFIMQPRSSVTHSYLLYAGPSIKQTMEEYGLESAVSFGLFGGISEIILSGLGFFHRIFKNWGVAVVLLSACVNTLLFPLSRKSYEAMKKMQELQPHMEKLRSEHKDNPRRLNKEMVELYKKYNVNPMGGCLPIFLQIPIFVALYQALMRSLNLRGAKFLWIRDLSMPDAVRLPFTIPGLGSSLNILPIFMSAAMVLQQKIASPAAKKDTAQANQQRQMMIIMPLLFLFIMYNFPSGLVLYWVVNTLLTIFEQRAIIRRG